MSSRDFLAGALPAKAAFFVPLYGLFSIFGNSHPLMIHPAKIIHSPIVFLISGFSEPFEGNIEVFGNPLAQPIQNPKVRLSLGVSLFSRFPKPVSGFFRVLDDAPPLFIHHSDFILGIGVILFLRLSDTISRLERNLWELLNPVGKGLRAQFHRECFPVRRICGSIAGPLVRPS